MFADHPIAGKTKPIKEDSAPGKSVCGNALSTMARKTGRFSDRPVVGGEGDVGAVGRARCGGAQ